MSSNILKKIFNPKSTEQKVSPERIRLNLANLNQWPKFEKLLKEGKIKYDSKGRLRYLHGAPVGDLILTENKGKKTIYQESAEEWFDPESLKAKEFVWP